MERLLTKDRLVQRDILDLTIYSLCDREDEANEHLYFSCSYSMIVQLIAMANS